MTFQFQIDSSVEVHKDPLGHHHHWTILVGKLLEGTIRHGDYLILPLSDKTVLATRVGGFESASQTVGPEISTGQDDGALGIMTWRPAAQSTEIRRDIARDGTAEEFHTMLLETLQQHPTRIFHHRGAQASSLDCHDCAVLPNTPEFITLLRNLQAATDTYLARRASLVLHTWAL